MVYWNMLKKLRGHEVLAAGEKPLAAVYGLGEAMLAMADGAAESLSGSGSGRALDGPEIYSNELEAATEGRHRAGLASGIVGNGVLGLTNQRLLWFKKATVVGRPGKLTESFPLDRIIDSDRRGNILRIVFDDGSISGLHVPKTQKPQSFVDEFDRIATRRD